MVSQFSKYCHYLIKFPISGKYIYFYESNLSMKLCQIFPYGGEDLWIKLSLREFPETKWLIILSNKIKKRKKAKYEEVDEKRKAEEQINYYKRAKTLMDKLKNDEEIIPPEKRRRFSLLEPISLDDFYELLRYFRALIDYVKNQGYKIAIHLNSGPMIWRMALYQAAAEFKPSINSIYLFEKDSGNRQNLWIYRKLTKQEKLVIEILTEKPRLNISEIQEIYKKKAGTGSLSYVLKIVKSLVKDDLISETKAGRTKWVELTSLGNALSSFDDFKQKIEDELNSEANR